YVITLSGTLEFTTRDGETFIMRPGDVLVAIDHVGTGHKWRLIDDQPWRRATSCSSRARRIPSWPRPAAEVASSAFSNELSDYNGNASPSDYIDACLLRRNQWLRRNPPRMKTKSPATASQNY